MYVCPSSMYLFVAITILLMHEDSLYLAVCILPALGIIVCLCIRKARICVYLSSYYMNLCVSLDRSDRTIPGLDRL